MNLISCEKLEKSMVELQFSIDAETFKAAVNNAFKREGKKYAIPGFRKGKAPRHMIEKMYGSDIFHYDAVNDLFPEAYEAAVKEAKIDVVGRPDPEVVSMSEADGVVLKVKVAVKPEVELGEYAGLTVTKEAKNVNEADVDAEVKRMQDRNGRLLTREGAAENGDTVDIDFEGFVDGKAFEGGKAEHYSLVLGSGSFIPGFEDQVVGHSAGEEFDVNVKFPEEYQAEELAGKEATFKCKVHKVQERKLPELNDLFSKMYGFANYKEFEQNVHDALVQQKEQAARSQVQNALLEQIVANSEIDLSDEFVNAFIEQMLATVTQDLARQGASMEQYLAYRNITDEQLRAEMRPQAEATGKASAVLASIAQQEGIVITDEDVDNDVRRMAMMYQMDYDKLAGTMDEAARESVRNSLEISKALQLVFDASIEE